MSKIPGLVTLFFIIMKLKNIINREIKYGNIKATLKLTGFILLIIIILFSLWFIYITLLTQK